MSKNEILDESEVMEATKKFYERLRKTGQEEAKNLAAESIEPLATEESTEEEAKRLQEKHINKNLIN